jgi:predicted aspartyl protease
MLIAHNRCTCTILALLIVSSATLPAQNIAFCERLDLIHDKPFVMVTVNGKGPFRFVIDTGTGGQAFVSSELAQELDLPSTGRIRVSDPSRQGGQKVPMVSIKSLNVAGIEFTNIKAAVHRLGNGDGSYQGLLGFVLFRDYLLTLDFPRRELRLTSGTLAPDGEQFVLPFRMPDGLPIVSLHIDGLAIDAQIDSGGTGLSLPQNFSARLRFATDPAPFRIAQSLSTRFQIETAKLSENVHLGAYTFKRPNVELNRAFPLANFGSTPMQSFAITFDQKNELVRFEAKQKTLRLSTGPSSFGLLNSQAQRPPDTAIVPID